MNKDLRLWDVKYRFISIGHYIKVEKVKVNAHKVVMRHSWKDL